ncbi:CUB domain-containing protein 1 [Zootoca vivipara]|uniref:CUB domain-containing protein 1 n=1 Tax=Zootoca vivipara TaxID=8524 RepID=UPI00293BDEA3|nr:CUB domain-containing protein 1 [Zootoca vivipara]
MAAGFWVAFLPLAQLLLLAAVTLQRAGAFEISLQRLDNTSVKIKPAAPGRCALVVGGNKSYSERKITSGQWLHFTFDCRTPENYWELVIERDIDCMRGPCPFGDVLLQPSGFLPFNKTFIWDVKARRLDGLELKFYPFLKQVLPGETCPDQVLYTIGTLLNTNRVNIGNFCGNGTVSRIKVQGGVIMTLKLPWNSKVGVSGFKLEGRSSIQRLCIVESTFQTEGEATLMSANYPVGLPENELVAWQFVIPFNLRARISILNYTTAKCERNFQTVEYQLPGQHPQELVPKEGQSVVLAGNFNLSMQGCKQYQQDAGAHNLHFKLFVQRPENEENVTYIVDLKKERGLNLTIFSKPTQPGSLCLICINRSKKCETNVTLVSGSSYTIVLLCKNTENVRVTAVQSTVCWNSKTCQMRPFHLVVPPFLTWLPILLETFTWKLQAPADTIIEIRSPTSKLKQHIPNQNQVCTGGYSYSINGSAPEKALRLGVFCLGGAIEKIQMKDNITVMLKTYGRRWINESLKPNLTLFFMPVIQEECVFSVIPDPKTEVYLQTPNWLEGLPPYISVYWNITVPAKQVAQLSFPKDRMGVTCVQSRANIYIQEQRPNAEETVRREDQKLPKTLDLKHHFWVNITNCKPATNQQLSMQFRVKFIQKKAGLAVIIGVVVGGIALLSTIGLLIFCAKRKKKKQENQAPAVGVYNGNVNTQLPGKQGIFKKRKKNESHIYAVIDDTMVYGHLLDESMKPENAEIGVYQPFTGPVSTAPSPPPIRKISKVPSMEEPSFTILTDSEIYTFAHRKPEELQANGDVTSSGNGNVGKSLLEENEQENSEL